MIDAEAHIPPNISGSKSAETKCDPITMETDSMAKIGRTPGFEQPNSGALHRGVFNLLTAPVGL